MAELTDLLDNVKCSTIKSRHGFLTKAEMLVLGADYRKGQVDEHSRTYHPEKTVYSGEVIYKGQLKDGRPAQMQKTLISIFFDSTQIPEEEFGQSVQTEIDKLKRPKAGDIAAICWYSKDGVLRPFKGMNIALPLRDEDGNYLLRNSPPSEEYLRLFHSSIPRTNNISLDTRNSLRAYMKRQSDTKIPSYESLRDRTTTELELLAYQSKEILRLINRESFVYHDCLAFLQSKPIDIEISREVLTHTIFEESTLDRIKTSFLTGFTEGIKEMQQRKSGERITLQDLEYLWQNTFRLAVNSAYGPSDKDLKVFPGSFESGK